MCSTSFYVLLYPCVILCHFHLFLRCDTLRVADRPQAFMYPHIIEAKPPRTPFPQSYKK